MITVDIPGYGALELAHLVMDYNGTLAVDGLLEDGVPEMLVTLADRLTIHVVTADTFGRAAEQLRNTPAELTILPPGAQDRAKQTFVESLGASHTVAIGNGRNDRMMLAAARLGIAVILQEGAAWDTLAAADVVCRGIVSALELLTNPKRLIATLRA